MVESLSSPILKAIMIEFKPGTEVLVVEPGFSGYIGVVIDIKGSMWKLSELVQFPGRILVRIINSPPPLTDREWAMESRYLVRSTPFNKALYND